MVTGSATESETPILSAQVRSTIQFIKEIVKGYSDAEIYIALKEYSMEPNETIQKLLQQDPFHEVKSRKDKKKEGMGYKGSADPRKYAESADRGMKNNKFPDRNADDADQGTKYNKFPDRNADNADRGMKYNKFPDRNADQGMTYNKFPGRNTESYGQGTNYSKFPDRNADDGQGTKYIRFPDRTAVNAGQGGKNNKFPGRNAENTGQAMKYNKFPDRTSQSSTQGIKYNGHPDQNVRRGGYTRNAFHGVTREFRVVRDNRVNQNTNREVKPPSLQNSTEEEVVLNPSENGTPSTSVYQKPLDGQNRSQPSNGVHETHHRNAWDASSSGSKTQEVLEEKQITVSSSVPRIQAEKPSNSQSNSATSASSNSVVGLYSSSTDPVHVPSPDSRSSAGVVGVRPQPSENSVKHSSAPNNLSSSAVGREKSIESFRQITAVSKTEQNTYRDSTIPSISSRLPSNNNQYSSRQHQVAGHQKALQPTKEWKPKSSQKSSVVNPGVIGTPTKSASPPVDNSEDLQVKNTQVNIHENQNVIIAQHIRVPETDRCQLTFGSFGLEFDSSRNFVSGGATDEAVGESAGSLSVSTPESSVDDAPGSKHADLSDDQVQNSGSDSSLSGAPSERHSVDKKESSSPQNIENYADIGLVRDNSLSYAPSVSQQQQDPPELPSYSAYDPQTGYERPYFRSMMDESVRGHGLPSPQEGLNSIPSSTIAMVQQQHPQQMAQMYPQQVHVSHYGNLMPYRHLMSPVYVPPMALPGYSNNPVYPHPPNGNNYVLMPGGGSQFNAGLKYGIQQFKPVPSGSPTGYGNFPNPSGYAINAPGVVGSVTGLEDSSRIKFKDGNLYVPNVQAETSEMWIQHPRDIVGMQSAQYYNVPGQTPHAAYIPSHTGHLPFNPAVAQTSHMQFQGLYHPQQPAAMGGALHLGPAIGGNVGVGVPQTAPGGQGGAYQQQPQLSHLNWTSNF